MLPLNLIGQDETEKDSITGHHAGRLQFEVGFYSGIPLGDNFFNDIYSFQLGVEHGMDVFLSKNWLLGIRFSHAKTKLEKPEITGSIKRTNLSGVGLHGGYVWTFTRQWDLNLLAGFGYTRFRHKSIYNTSFRDDAFSIWINPKLAYRLNSTIGFSSGLKLKNDFMNIETSPNLHDYFNEARSLTFSMGLRITVN